MSLDPSLDSSQETTPNKCWNCGQDLGAEQGLFCPHCHSLQPPPSDYFHIFGLPLRLNLDTADLQQRFYALSKQLHPDRFSRKTPREQNYSEQAMSVVNDAYRVLRDPVQRAEYVLRRGGLEIGEQRSKDVPPELLEEVFELNMALEEMRSGDDEARPQLEQARTRFDTMLREVDRDLEQAFQGHDAVPEHTIPNPQWNTIRGILNRRRYIQNLVREVESALS